MTYISEPRYARPTFLIRVVRQKKKKAKKTFSLRTFSLTLLLLCCVWAHAPKNCCAESTSAHTRCFHTTQRKIGQVDPRRLPASFVLILTLLRAHFSFSFSPKKKTQNHCRHHEGMFNANRHEGCAALLSKNSYSSLVHSLKLSVDVSPFHFAPEEKYVDPVT